ncbi:Ppx/GppA phosphatase family protein [Microvirga sp. W0021]|uniref:Ppx/GppA phosphatase family protein n=1 Tax=Hohaiivirga grylli TaxID=3133970 RepID=A0ABV0BJX1_9HYPH
MNSKDALKKSRRTAGNFSDRRAGHPRLGHRRIRKNSESGNVYAALDLGTNNCRLLVARASKNGFRIVNSFSRIVRLGEGMRKTHYLSEEAMERTLQALQICKSKLQNSNVTRSRLIATEACRSAKNGREFAKRVEELLGLELEIIDHETEAYLAVAGCASLIDPRAESCIIFDIGGGSTEIAWLEGTLGGPLADPKDNIRVWDSIPAGVVSLAEEYDGHNVTRASYEAMVESITEKLAGFAEKAKGAENAPYFHLLGTSGTVTTLGGIYLGLPKYDRRRVDGLWMTEQDMTDIINRLIQMSYEERVANPCIGTERADLVLAGCAILDAIRRTFPSRFLRIADRGLREGILMTMMREDGVWHQGA